MLRPTPIRAAALLLSAALVLGTGVAYAGAGDEGSDHKNAKKLQACYAAAQRGMNESLLRERCGDLGDGAWAERLTEHRARACHQLKTSDHANATAVDRVCSVYGHGTATLGVVVTARSPDGPKPAADAKVVIYKAKRTDQGYQVFPVERGETDERGVALFELPKGAYLVRASHDEIGKGHARVHLVDDQRVHVHLGHGKPDVQPGPAALGIRALQRTADGIAPVPGATVTIEKYNATRDAPRNGTWEFVTEGTTDDRGLFPTVLPKGLYRVLVVDEANDLVGHKRIPLRHDTWVRIGMQPAGAPSETSSLDESAEDGDHGNEMG